MFRKGEFIDEKYRVLREAGLGAYGVVYEAEELDRMDLLDSPSETVLRRVAIKIVDRLDVRRKRFGAEVRALCRLNHPAIVQVYGYGVTLVDPVHDRGEDNPTRPYVAMEFVDGRSLADVPAPEARGNLARFVGIFIHVAEALAHAHARGVIHRDLKPHNILVGSDGLPRVVDFGLSWLVQPDQDASRRLGTPGYIAPELLDAEAAAADHRADVYSLGATMFAVFAGRSPFRADGLMATMRAQMCGEFEFPDEFPSALQSLVRRCLSPDPLNRPRTASLVAEELRLIALSPGVIQAGGEDAHGLDEFPELPERVDVRDGRITALAPFDHPTRGAGLKFSLMTGEAESTGGFVYAGTENSAARRVHDVLASAWEGAEVSIYDTRPVQDSSARRFLAADGSTVPVLEPYFPVSVTDVATAEGVRCGTCASRVLVDVRARRDWGTNLVIGSVAHDMLESLVREDRSLEEFDAIFDESLAARRIDAVAAGITDDDVAGIRTRLRAHFENLRRWTEPARTAKLAEVKRYSSRYGLEGRIDLALVDESETQIIELKTGSYESPQHERQLRCYALLWDAIAAANGSRVVGRLLYSKTGKLKPLNRRSHDREREVVIARNDVVAMHRHYSDGDTSYRPLAYGDDPQRCNDYPCRFRRKECERQRAVLGNFHGGDLALEDIDRDVWAEDVDNQVVRATREYYAHYVRLIEREYRAASRAMGAVFRTTTIGDRVARLRALDDVTLRSSSRADRRVVFACDAFGVFEIGDPVIAHRGDFDAEPALSGRVVRRDRDSLAIECAGADFATDLPSDGWVIDKDVLRIGFRAMHQALYRFVSCSDAARLERIVLPSLGTYGQRTLPGTDAPTKQWEVSGSGTTELNVAQREAVARALESSDAFLIHGPPGTGKTTVIAELVAELIAADKRILLAACTHTAVNNVLARVVRAGVTDVLRVGSVRRSSDSLTQALLDAKRPLATHFSDELGRDASSLQTLGERLRSVRVVAATTNACVSSSVFSVIEDGGEEPAFDVAIIDEASQLTEPLALAAINLARRFVLVGDDKQLPPVVTADDALSHNVDPPAGVLATSDLSGLDHSLFARLRPHVPHVMLTTQYRMSESVQAFPNQAFYGGRLNAWHGVRDRTMPAGSVGEAADNDPLDPERGFVWIESQPAETPRRNDHEVAIVAETVGRLLASLDVGAPGSAIGVVSPYRAQCHAIRSALRELDGGAAVEVDTVERFQGRQKEVMLVSLVTSDWSDFVMSPERLNVTLTRARSKVIVIGSAAVRQRFFDSYGGS